MSDRILIQHLLDRRAGLTLCTQPSPTATTVLLAPTTPVSGRLAKAGTAWIPPSDSIASRLPALKSRGSCRGSTIDHRTNRQLVFESELESGFAAMLMARTDIDRIIDQPPAVGYVDPEGKHHRHTFDFLTVSPAGIRIAFAIKPEAKVEKSGIKEITSLIQAQVGSRFADRYLVRTEHHITKTRVFNARLILRARRCNNDQDTAIVRDLTSKLQGTARIADLVEHSKLGARGFNALTCLIADRHLELVAETRIDYRAAVRRPATH